MRGARVRLAWVSSSVCFGREHLVKSGICLCWRGVLPVKQPIMSLQCTYVHNIKKTITAYECDILTLHIVMLS